MKLRPRDQKKTVVWDAVREKLACWEWSNTSKRSEVTWHISVEILQTCQTLQFGDKKSRFYPFDIRADIFETCH